MLAKLCIGRGVQKIKDLIFVDEAIFVERGINYLDTEELSQIEFIGNTGEFKSEEYLNFTW